MNNINPKDEACELAAELGQLLIERNYTITCAESCTGGLLAGCLTDVPGASAWFDQSWVTYSNQSKIDRVAVNAATLKAHGAVSEQTVLEMAKGARIKAAANIGVAISGVAGPTGGTADKPVGTVWIAWSVNEQILEAKVAVLTGSREEVRQAAVIAALSGIIKLINNQ